MKRLTTLTLMMFCWLNLINTANADHILDESRDRNIPIEVSLPNNAKNCSSNNQCKVAFLSAGYGVPHTKYTFLSKLLNEQGYMVVAIGHELPSDPRLSVTGNLFKTRSENWQRGADTLNFLKNKLSKQYKHYNFDQLVLVGHSNGGDISAWLASEDKSYIETIITLDHRRVPLPRSNKIKVFSIRASDFPADKGVLPTALEQQEFNSCIITIPNAKHNDIADHGPQWLKTSIQELVFKYLQQKNCVILQST